ncbi:hypothetical protein Dda_2989 [Drechslerella dactyloides]|uniref:Uncharacterized protein n=1 Tax=Drechslerella dactyloides TaxID=74499 RepID=A0AAD6J0H6_DREDA|nr:hypothetical protein Dda_2989 [Drechslerella dactyloides]
MRCLRPRQTSLNLCRRCALSTSCTALPIDTHSASSVSVGSAIDCRPARRQHRRDIYVSEPWLAYRALPPPPPAPRLPAVPVRATGVGKEGFGLRDQPGVGVAAEEVLLGVPRLPVKSETRAAGAGLPRGVAVNESLAGSALIADGFFLSSTTGGGGKEKDKEPVSERTLNLGKTIDILKENLPTLLQSPLPSEILSPSITLRLFPSTHPHLPSVRGRMAYIAALWTAPVVWGRIPGIKVRLEILSVKMIKGGIPLDEAGERGGEQMIVKWRASSTPNGNGEESTAAAANGESASASTSAPSSPSNTPVLTSHDSAKGDPLSSVTSALPKFTINGDFCGLFIFEFDELGRIKTHIIEDVENQRGEVSQHSKVITLTEWLLKKAKSSLEEKPPVPGLAFERLWQSGGGRCRGRSGLPPW